VLTISNLRQAVSELNKKEAEAITKELLSQGLDPMEILEEGVVKGLTELGERFAAKKAIVLDLVKGGITAKACIPHIQAAFPKDSQVPKEKKIVLGTMLSQHNIGKNLVGTLLSIGGFEVIDRHSPVDRWLRSHRHRRKERAVGFLREGRRDGSGHDRGLGGVLPCQTEIRRAHRSLEAAEGA
jgi:5-methyltetrahydrofolate--homocysteine methyltransferase